MRVLASSLMLNATFPLDVLAQTAPAAVAQPATGQPFNTEQLDALVASIALYPDDLLTQLLMASTFPLEVVAAARWVEDPAHKSLSGDALVKALEAQPWDPSVKSLVPFPVVLATLNSNLTWLQQLGYAFATQQADVFAAVQRLRRLAQANDKLQSSPQQVVSTQQVTVEPPAGSSQPPTQQEVIVIQPAQSDTVYVPSYDPAAVYGSSWPYSVISAVLPGSAARLLFRHRAGHRAGICGRRRGRGRAMGLGESRVGRRLRERQRQPIQQHQRQSVADHFKPLGRGRWEWAARQFRPCARRTGGPSRPFASLRTRQCGAASDTPGRSRWRGRCRRRWSAGWSRRRGRCRRRWSAGWSRRRGRCRRRWSAGWSRRRGRCRRRWSAGWSRRRGRCRRSLVGRVVPAAWAVSAALVGRVVPAAWAVSAALVGGRPGGVGGVGGLPAGRPSGAAGGGQRPTGAQRPGGAFGDMSSGRQAGQFGTAGRAEPIRWSAAIGGRRRAAVAPRRSAVAARAAVAVAARRRRWPWRRRTALGGHRCER